MKLYKDSTGTVWAFEDDGSQDHLIISDMVPITNEQAEEINRQKQIAKFNALSYVDKRAAEYPPITDYLDGVVKGDQTQIDKYIADCQAVKTKYPKG